MKTKNFFLFVLLFSLLLRLGFSSFGTYWGDMYSWLGWSNRLLEVGFVRFYQAWCDYLPGYLYVLFLLGKLRIFLHSLNFFIPDNVLFKMPSIFADIFTGYLIYKLVQKLKNNKLALVASIFYVFNPAILANSTFWGQADSFFSLFLVLGFWLLAKKNLVFSSLVFSFAGLVKPQGLLVLPFVLLFVLKTFDLKRTIYFLLGFFGLYFLAFVPFANQRNVFLFIKQRLELTFNQYSYTSLNAFNFWSFIGLNWTRDKIFKWLGFLIFGLLNFTFLFFLIKKWSKDFKTNSINLLKAFTLVFFASFLFLTRVHERHLFPIFPFLASLAAFYSDLWLVYLISSCVYLLNLRFAFVWLTQDFKSIFPQSVVQTFSFLQILGCFYVFIRVFFNKGISLRKLTGYFKKFFNSKEKASREIKVKRKTLILTLILFFSFLTRFYRLGLPNKHIFDEVYHAFTAQEMVKGNKAAWEWWNTPPEGFAYEWTHPPLAKLLMASGILIFGNKPFAWRLPAALFGTSVIFLTFLIAKKLFNNEKIALLAAFLASFDGLLLTMSRIGMSDIYFLFFLLSAIYFCLKENDFLSGIFLGLAISTKWTGIYLYLVIGVILVKNVIPNLFRNLYRFRIRFDSLSGAIKRLIIFILIPPAIYLLSYILFFTSGHTWSQFIELQRQMWWYHTGLKATHNYQSAAWTWPFMIRSVWLYVDYQQDKIGNIYALGNPFLWWSWLAVTLLAIIEGFKKRSFNLLFIVFCYFAFWLPWIFSPRIMFLYHYLPAIPFLCILLAWSLVELSKSSKEFKLLVTCYLLLVTLVFFFFYPIYTGILIPKDFLAFYFWLPSWR